MSTEVGSGHVAVVPSFRGFRRATTREFSAAARDGRKGFSRGVAGAGEEAGGKVGRGFKAAFGKGAAGAGQAAMRDVTRAVSNASRDLSRARMREADATGAARVAESRLADARKKYASDSTQVVRAEESLARASRKVEDAQARTAIASERLTQAKAALGSASSRTGGIISRVGQSIRGGWQRAMSGMRALTEATASALKGAFVGVGLVVAGAMTGALAGGWTRMTAIEDARAKLKGLGNDARAVESIMESALASVEGTAFGLGDAATVAATAVAAGVTPGAELTRYLSTVASGAAAANIPMTEMGQILNKVTTSGRAYTQEINQIADRGLPIWKELAAQYGVTQERMREMVSAGEVDADKFVAAVEAMSGSVADELGGTTTGTLRNMRTAFSRLGATVLTPFQETFRDLFQTIRDGVDALNRALGPAVTDLASKVNGTLLPAMQGLRDLFAAGFTIDTGGLGGALAVLAPALGGILGMLGPMLANLPLIGGAFGALTGPVGIFAGLLVSLFAFDADTLAAGFQSIMTTIPQLISGAATMLRDAVISILPDLLGSLTSNLPLLVTGGVAILMTLVQAIVDAIPMLAGTASLIIGMLVHTLSELGPALIEAIVGGLTTLIPAIIGIIPVLVTALLGLLPQVIEGGLALFMGLLEAVIQVVPMLIETVIGLLPVLLTALLEMLPGLIEGALQLFLGLVLGLAEAIPAIIIAVLELLPMLLTTLIGMIPTLILGAVQLFLGLVLGLAEALPQIISAVIGLLPVLIEALISMIPMILEASVQLFLAIVQAIGQSVPEIIGAIVELGPMLWDAILGLGPMLLDAGAAIMQSLADGITNALGVVGDAIGGAMDWIGGFFPHSPAKRGPFSGSGWRAVGDGGKALMEEFASGAETRSALDMSLRASMAGAGGAGAAAVAGARQHGARIENIYQIPESLSPFELAQFTTAMQADQLRRVGAG